MHLRGLHLSIRDSNGSFQKQHVAFVQLQIIRQALFVEGLPAGPLHEPGQKVIPIIMLRFRLHIVVSFERKLRLRGDTKGDAVPLSCSPDGLELMRPVAKVGNVLRERSFNMERHTPAQSFQCMGIEHADG